MSNYTRKVRKRQRAASLEAEHAAAMADIKLWEQGLQHHYHVATRRLMMAGMSQAPAELAAYRAIVKGLQGRDDTIGAEDIPEEF